MSQGERPRERLMKYGPRKLSNAELLAIVLRQGSKRENVLELAHKLLQKNNIKELSRTKAENLKKILGSGEANACQIMACFELGRRLASFKQEKKVRINSAKDVAKIFLPEMSTLQKELFKGVYIDARKNIIKEETIFVGSLNTSVIHPREIFQPAITYGAAAVILIHNHPSGDPNPSEEDVEITKQLIESGNILEIEVLDHIIIGDKKYFSLREKGYF